MFKRIRQWADLIKRETVTLYLAARDPRTPWYAKAVAACVVAYALSPLDLIPDFIPVLGYLDDVILIPIGLWLALRLIPDDVIADCRAQASRRNDCPTNYTAAVVVIVIWSMVVAAIGWLLLGNVRI